MFPWSIPIAQNPLSYKYGLRSLSCPINQPVPYKPKEPKVSPNIGKLAAISLPTIVLWSILCLIYLYFISFYKC